MHARYEDFHDTHYRLGDAKPGLRTQLKRARSIRKRTTCTCKPGRDPRCPVHGRYARWQDRAVLKGGESA